jgi:hypothetical protein
MLHVSLHKLLISLTIPKYQPWSTTTTVVGGTGADVVNLVTSGANAISINDATVAVTGGSGIDTITLTAVTTAATIVGAAGADVITLVTGTNAGVVINDTDGFTLTGGTINTIVFTNSNAAITATSITGGSGIDTYTFGTGSNVATITGGGGVDVINAGASHDTVVFSGNTDALNGEDTITGFLVGSGGDILKFSSLTSGAIINTVSGTAITMATVSALATEGTTIAMTDEKLMVIKVTNAATIDTAAEVITALADTGVMDAVDVAASVDGFFVIMGLDDTTKAYVYAIDNDGTAAIVTGELVLVATVTVDSLAFITTNFAY